MNQLPPLSNQHLSVAFEAPVQVIDRLQDFTDFDFIIGSEIKKNLKYEAVFSDRTDRYRVLDSGAFEGEMLTNEEHLDMAFNMHVDEIVVPDVMGSIVRTLTLWEQFKRQHTFALTVQAVVCGETFADWMDCLSVYLEDERCDVIGLSYAIPPRQIPPDVDFNWGIHPYDNARVNVLLRLARLSHVFKSKCKPIHLLGLADLRALPFYRAMPFVRSIDTSFPVQAAMQGCQCLFAEMEKPQGLMDFNHQPKDATELGNIYNAAKDFRRRCTLH